MRVGGHSQKRVTEVAGMEGSAGHSSSVLDLENKKMSVSLFTKRVAF